MFDFLNEEKRQVLASHKVLKNLKKFPDDYKEFLQNLKAFRTDLCSDTEPTGAKKQPYQVFTEEDILQIKTYVESILLGVFIKIRQLRDRILKEAGFEVWVHAGGRVDLNDWIQNPDFYVRGVHNLSEFYIKNALGQETCYSFVVPLYGDITTFPKKVAEPLRIQPKVSGHTSMGHIINPSEVSFSNDRYNIDIQPYETATRPGQQLVLPFYLRCCIFCKDQKYRTERRQTGTKTVEVPHPLFGKLGMTTKKSVPTFTEDSFLIDWKPVPLNRIVKSNETVPAYLLQFFLPKIVPDRLGRTFSDGHPLVNLVASKNLVEEITAFLLEYPNSYMDLVRQFLPGQMFPNINKGILNAWTIASRGLIFDNYTCEKRATIK